MTRFVASARLFRDKTQFVAAVPICKVYIFCDDGDVLFFFIDVDF